MPDNFHIHSFNSSNVCEDCGESYEDNGLIFTKAANDLFHVTGYVGTASEVIIPSKFQGLPVAGIGYEAFAYKDVLVRVILPESIISISNNAFTNCENLTYISIPSNTTRIGNGVFASCNKLLQKENGVYYVDKWAVDCDEIATSVTLRSNTVGIANSAFYNCNSLTDVILPEGVLSICSGAFYNCAKLENINIPDSVIYIDSAVFSGCNALIESENGVNYVDRWVVGCNMTVDTVTLRKNTVGISTSALSGASITQINIPEGVKIIDRGAFNGCYNMVGVIIPKTVKTIGMGAFNNCDNLSTVYYTGSNSQWESIQIDSTNDSLTSASMVFNYIQ
ncbi:MAG: leucine-rich repeat domain-containing protein [Clostridia bacterium]|nr:leucine-rich repeat domain-containing protein [Clostridia bacterium]